VEAWSEKLSERIRELKGKRPAYGPMLDFYQKIREEQERVSPSVKMKSIAPKKEDFPLLQKKEFPLDLGASAALFHTLCGIAKETNLFLSEQVAKIEEALQSRKAGLKEWLEQGWDEKRIGQVAETLDVAPTVLALLVQGSLKPSVEATVAHLRNELNAETWLKGHCPICGSLPCLSLFREDSGKRFLQCSFCGYQWRMERLVCPYCDNTDPRALHYFSGEGEETCRIDLCDQCHQYIKTIDFRISDVFEPALEDLATLHLDLLASQQGYGRPVASFWIPSTPQRVNDPLLKKEK
jgi:FdhE protein